MTELAQSAKAVLLVLLIGLVFMAGMALDQFANSTDASQSPSVDKPLSAEVPKCECRCEPTICPAQSTAVNSGIQQSTDLTPSQAESLEKTIPGLALLHPCEAFNTTLPKDQFLSVATKQSTAYYGGTEFALITQVTLKRIGQELATRAHTAVYDARKRSLVACDPPITFPYADWPLEKAQESPRSY